MRARHFNWRNSCAAITATVACAGLGSPVVAQGTAPVANPPAANPAPVASTPASSTSPPQQSDRGGVLPRFPALAAQLNDPNAPPWVITSYVDVGLTVTDNAGYTAHDKHADILGTLGGGISISGDTPRIKAGLLYNAYLIGGLSDVSSSYLAQSGFANAQTILVPDVLLLTLNGSASTYTRGGFGSNNVALLNGSQTIQTYVLSATPSFHTPVSDLGVLDVSYSYARFWLAENIGTVPLANVNLGPLSGGEQQFVSGVFDMPGTFNARLRTMLAANASTITSGPGFGTLRRASGTVVNEYQLTRSVALIAAGGYERLSNKVTSQLNGEGVTWDAGARITPNPDSSIVFLYGKHDLNTDFAGEVSWRITPLTNFYASYTDSITTAQGGVIGATLGATLSENGPSLGVTQQDDPIIPLLARGGLTPGVVPPLGVAFGSANGATPFFNGFYRLRSFRSNVSREFFGEPINLSFIHYDQEPLGQQSFGFFGAVQISGGPSIRSDSLIASWTPFLPYDMIGRVDVRYEQNNFGRNFGLSLSASYGLSPTLYATAGYDLIDFKYDGTSSDILVNAITLRLRKTFE